MARHGRARVLQGSRKGCGEGTEVVLPQAVPGVRPAGGTKDRHSQVVLQLPIQMVLQRRVRHLRQEGGEVYLR